MTKPIDDRNLLDQLWKKAERRLKPVDPTKIIAGLAQAEARELRMNDFAERIRNIPPGTRSDLEDLWRNVRATTPRVTNPNSPRYTNPDDGKFDLFVTDHLWIVFTNQHPYALIDEYWTTTYVQALCDALQITMSDNLFGRIEEEHDDEYNDDLENQAS